MNNPTQKAGASEQNAHPGVYNTGGMVGADMKVKTIYEKDCYIS